MLIDEGPSELPKIHLIIEADEDRAYFAKISKQVRNTISLFPEASPRVKSPGIWVYFLTFSVIRGVMKVGYVRDMYLGVN